MKYLFLVLIVFLAPLTAKAQTPVSKETANSYFANCVKTASPTQGMSANGQQMLCACTAARLTQFFTMEDWQNMTSPSPEIARPAYNKMLIDVYAPCMSEPTREYHYTSCMQNPSVTKLGNAQNVCNCAADALAQHMQYHGSSMFEKILAREPNIADPNAALFNDPDFQQVATQKTMGCLK